MIEEAPSSRHFARPLTIIGLGALAALVLAGIGIAIAIKLEDPNRAAFHKLSRQLPFPLYYPAGLPNYFFLDRGSITTKNNVVIFSIVRNDQQKIYVTEEALPQDFNLAQVTGTRANLPGVGRLAIGSGLLGYRAVIQSSGTLTLLTCKTSISDGDFSSIVKDFRLSR